MKNKNTKHVFGIPISSTAYSSEKSCRQCLSITANQSEKLHKQCLSITANQYYASPKYRQSRMESVFDKMSKISEKVENLAQGIREHVKIGAKLSETVKGKLRLGARILQVGGVKKVFKHNFSVRDGEKLLKASQCYLSTTSGPIAGLLFISTDRVSFCSERSIKISNSNGDFLRIHYKVSIPIQKIKRADQSENMKDPSRKYIDIVTKDDFEFWFMGFLNHQRTFNFLQLAVYQEQ